MRKHSRTHSFTNATTGDSSAAKSGVGGHQSKSLRGLLPSATFFQCDDMAVTKVIADLNDLQGGELCIFRSGEHDPVEFAASALAGGASGIITDQLLPCPLPQVIVGDVEVAASDLMNQWLDRPSEKLMMIGVVGNAGKTTTALMIAGVLRGLGIRAAYETDLGSSDGIVQTVDNKDAPRGPALISRISEAHDVGCGVAVIEFTSEVAAAHSGVNFDLLVVTGSSTSLESIEGPEKHFGPDPLMIALDHLAKDAVVIVPADHPKLVRRIDDTGRRRLTYGLRRQADLSAKVFDNQPGETTLMISCGDETAAMETQHCGEAMAMNQLAAIAVAMLLETTLVDAIETVAGVPAVPGRMHRITGFDSAAVIVDAGGSCSRIASTLRTLRQQRNGGKLWCVMTLDHTAPGSGDAMATCGRLVEKYADKVVLTSTDENKPNFLHGAHALLDGFREVTVARLVADRKRAIQWAMQNAQPRDTIVILGGLNGATAHESRSRVQALVSLITKTQRDPAIKRYVSPATIPMFGGT